MSGTIWQDTVPVLLSGGLFFHISVLPWHSLEGGLAMIKFSGHPLVTLLGWFFLPAGVVILAQGIITYIKVNRAVQAKEEKTDEAEQANI